MSPGWQFKALQMDSSVLKRIAFAFPVLIKNDSGIFNSLIFSTISTKRRLFEVLSVIPLGLEKSFAGIVFAQGYQ